MKFLYYIFLFMMSFCANAQPNIQLKGYSFILGKENNDSLLVEIKTYNKDTLLMANTTFSQNEEQYNLREEYNEKGQRMRKIYFSQDSFYVSCTEFERDSMGEISKQIMSNNGKEPRVLIQRNIYDVNKKIIKSYTEALGKEITDYLPSVYTAFSYDSNGNLTKMEQFVNNRLVSQYIYRYDEKKRKIEEKITHYKTNEKGRTNFYYNANNQLIKEENFYKNDLFSTYYYTWKGKLPTQVTIVYHQDNITEIRQYKE